jgi:hypothetical protein
MCSVVSHKKHDVFTLSDVLESLKEGLKKDAENLQTVANEVKKQKQEAIQKGRDVASLVQQSFNSIRQECDKREKTLLSQINQFTTQQVAILDEQINSIESKRSTLDNAM